MPERLLAADPFLTWQRIFGRCRTVSYFKLTSSLCRVYGSMLSSNPFMTWQRIFGLRSYYVMPQAYAGQTACSWPVFDLRSTWQSYRRAELFTGLDTILTSAEHLMRVFGLSPNIWYNSYLTCSLEQPRIDFYVDPFVTCVRFYLTDIPSRT